MSEVVLKWSFLIIWLIGPALPQCEGAHILAVLPSVWKSHYLFSYHILDQMVEQNNHTVTLISPYNMDKEDGETYMGQRIKEIKVDGLLENWLEMGLSFDIEEMHDKSVMEHFTRLMYATTSNIDRVLQSSKVRDLLQTPYKFDLLIVDLFLSDALLGLAFYYQIPTVVLSPSGSNTWLNQRFGNPQNAALDPSNFLQFSKDMTIWQRCINTLMAMFEKLTYSFFHMISQQAVYTKHFEPLCQLATWCKKLPHHKDLTENLSLALINTHSVLQYPRAFLPNMLSVAGIHLKTEDKLKLPNHLKEFIEGAKQGVVYMSFGANIYDFSVEKMELFLDVFETLPDMRFIIKYDEDEPLQMTLNVTSQMMIQNWWPQQSILAHENVKLFITSGGFMSITESINYHTNILAIPITSEQYVLCEKLYRQNAAYVLNYNELTYDHLLYAIKHILYNNSADYINHLKQLKKQLLHNLDGVIPMQKALNAIEMTLHTNGVDYLKPHSHHLNFWSSILMDVMLILILGLLTILAIPFLLTSCILKKSYQSQTNSKLLNKPAHRYYCKVNDFLSTTTTTCSNTKPNGHENDGRHDSCSPPERRRSSNSDIHEKRRQLSSACANSSKYCYCTYSVSSSAPATPLSRRESPIFGKISIDKDDI